MLTKLGIAAVFFAALLLFILWQNNDLTVSRTVYENRKVPEAFDGFTIVQISDLHNKEFGKRQAKLLKTVEDQKPDAIVITGDLVDRRRYDLEPARDFVQGAAAIAPVYYVCGNHEAGSGNYDEIRKMVEEAGGTVLENTLVKLMQNPEEDLASVTAPDPEHASTTEQEAIWLFGMADPLWNEMNGAGTPEAVWEEVWEEFAEHHEVDHNMFTVLTCHRPELFESYTRWGVDLVFTGHAHGGQFRFPGLGGLVAPGQGLFPKYTSGSYIKEETTMFVSRGLGNSIIPVRIFNRPEVVVVKLARS